MWANSVWGFAGFAGALGLAVLGLPPEYMWLKPSFIWGAVACAVLSLLVLCWPLRHPENRIKAKQAIKHPQKWFAENVEPRHLLIIGLSGVILFAAIALFSVIWRRQPTPDPHIAELQAKVAELERKLADSTKLKIPTTRLAHLTTEPASATANKGFTNRTIRELRALYEGRTRLQADAFMADEKGKLIEVDGVVVNIDSGMAFLEVAQKGDYVECRFGPEWDTKLGTYSQGQKMKIRGTIGPNQNGAQIYLQNCEIAQ